MNNSKYIIHMDQDAFFVSVEVRKDSSLMGKPVIIGGTSDRGVVASCSYEARKYGVHAAMPSRMAKILCPHAIFVRGNMDEYSKASLEITDILRTRVPLMEKASIDEHYIDMTGMDRFYGVMKYAHELRTLVMKETGLPISFGLSVNKTVSKMATNECKPNGELNIEQPNVVPFLNPLSIKKIPGLGEKTFVKLSDMGIKKIVNLAQIHPDMMVSVLGKNGLVLLNKAKGIDYSPVILVITKNEEGKNIVKKHENVSDALAFFKEQKGNSELAVGKDAANKVIVASTENGKVNYVAKEFNRTYYASPATQTIWLERGKGFTAEQAANLIQGRSVYRDDMMNMGGETYKAWIKLDFDKGKDRFQNYSINQYHDPSYGFDINKVLDKFNIKELEDPAKRVLLEASLRNGNRPLVTVEKEGQVVKVFLEAVPRYSQLNMYAENGKPEKREQFLKETALSSKQENTKGQEKEMSESQGVRR